MIISSMFGSYHDIQDVSTYGVDPNRPEDKGSPLGLIPTSRGRLSILSCETLTLKLFTKLFLVKGKQFEQEQRS